MRLKRDESMAVEFGKQACDQEEVVLLETAEGVSR
jgi:hypothetical protein